MANLHLSMLFAKRQSSDTIDVFWNNQNRHFNIKKGKLLMNVKIISYVVAVIGLAGIAVGVYWEFIKHDHPMRGLVALIIGVVLLIAGIVSAFVLKPKQAA